MRGPFAVLFVVAIGIVAASLIHAPLFAVTESFPAAISLTGQTASIATTQLYTAAPMGLYRVSYYIVTTTAGSAGTVLPTIAWNDGVGAQTVSTATVSLIALATFGQGSFTIWSGAQQNISYSTTVASVIGSPQYSIRVSLERLH